MERMVKYIKVQLQTGREMLCSALVQIPIVKASNSCILEISTHPCPSRTKLGKRKQWLVWESSGQHRK